MSADLDNVAVVVEGLRATPRAERKAKLQRLIGHRTESPLILDRRAKLVTALREAGLYPGESIA